MQAMTSRSRGGSAASACRTHSSGDETALGPGTPAGVRLQQLLARARRCETAPGVRAVVAEAMPKSQPPKVGELPFKSAIPLGSHHPPQRPRGPRGLGARCGARPPATAAAGRRARVQVARPAPLRLAAATASSSARTARPHPVPGGSREPPGFAPSPRHPSRAGISGFSLPAGVAPSVASAPLRRRRVSPGRQVARPALVGESRPSPTVAAVAAVVIAGASHRPSPGRHAVGAVLAVVVARLLCRLRLRPAWRRAVAPDRRGCVAGALRAAVARGSGAGSRRARQPRGQGGQPGEWNKIGLWGSGVSGSSGWREGSWGGGAHRRGRLGCPCRAARRRQVLRHDDGHGGRHDDEPGPAVRAVRGGRLRAHRARPAHRGTPGRAQASARRRRAVRSVVGHETSSLGWFRHVPDGTASPGHMWAPLPRRYIRSRIFLTRRRTSPGAGGTERPVVRDPYGDRADLPAPRRSSTSMSSTSRQVTTSRSPLGRGRERASGPVAGAGRPGPGGIGALGVVAAGQDRSIVPLSVGVEGRACGRYRTASRRRSLRPPGNRLLAATGAGRDVPRRSRPAGPTAQPDDKPRRGPVGTPCIRVAQLRRGDGVVVRRHRAWATSASLRLGGAA